MKVKPKPRKVPNWVCRECNQSVTSAKFAWEGKWICEKCNLRR